MGVLTDFFRATPAQLRASYKGWREPLATPMKQRRLNPFTKQMMEVNEWDPAPDVEVTDPGPISPPSPSIDLKGMSQIEVEMLCEVLLGEGHDAAESLYRPALIGPTDGPWLTEIPAALVNALSALSEDRIAPVARQWVELWEADQATIASGPRRDEEGIRSDREAFEYALRMLHTFARETVAEGKVLYMWMSL
jgi:hypothetical protein